MTSVGKVCSIKRACGRRGKKEETRKKMMVAVFEVTERPKTERHSTAMGSSHGAPIKVCKGRLTTACNPGVCDCPDETCKVKKTKKQILWTLIKCAIFGYAVKEAVCYGIWSDASKTEALTARYMAWAEEFFPTKNQTKRTPREVYDMSRIRYNIKNCWNNIIIGVNNFIASIPGTVYNAIDWVTTKKPEKETKIKK